jgi:DNA polymerase III subunit beta
MHVTLDRARLKDALARAASVVQARNTIPILQCVMITAGKGPDGGTVQILATDLDRSITITLPGEVMRPGSVCVPAAPLKTLVDRLAEGAQVEIEERAAEAAGTATLAVRSARTRVSLGLLPTDDFPAMPVPAVDAARLELAGKALASALDRVALCISNEETRYYLCGVHISQAGRKAEWLRLCATDGHRLARHDLAMPDGAVLPERQNHDGRSGLSVIVPRDGVANLVKLLGAVADTVTVDIDDHRLSVAATAAGWRYVSKLIDGTFPDYDRVIPTGHKALAHCEGRDLTAAVHRCSAVTTERSSAMALTFSRDGIEVEAARSEIGGAADQLDANFEADATLQDMRVGFSARYLTGVLDALGQGRVRIALTDPTSPAVFTDPDDGASLYLVMPMKV